MVLFPIVFLTLLGVVGTEFLDLLARLLLPKLDTVATNDSFFHSFKNSGCIWIIWTLH